MTRTSAIAMLAAILVLAAPAVSRAQGASAPPPGTNSAGAAQPSGGALNQDPGMTTGASGMGSGRAATPPTTSPETAIEDENTIIDRKLKGICRGC